jgi:hypothetical protein
MVSANQWRRWQRRAARRLRGHDCGHRTRNLHAYGIRGLDLAAEVKWLPEIDVTNRLSGDTVWFKLAISVGKNQENPLDAL